MTSVVSTGADERYGGWLLNLVGSIQRRSPIFDRIVAYDLGLSPFQRRLLDGADGVEIRTVPSFVPHWRQGRTWKTWIWTHLEADAIVWLDAGITVLRPLTDFLSQMDERGYFVVSQGVPNAPCIPTDYLQKYSFPTEALEKPVIASGILGFRRSGAFFDQVIVPTYDDALLGRSLGFSASEVTRLNRGLDRMDSPIVRDCPLFRHEQTLLSIHFYRAFADPHVNDLDIYGGWRSARDHPGQVIWSHRRNGDYRFLPRARYRPSVAPVGFAWGTWVYLKRRARNAAWLVRPSVHAHILRRLVRTRRLRSPRSDRQPSSPR